MADKSISELTQATEVTDSDLFVLQQGNVAKKLSGSTLKNYVVLDVVSAEAQTLPAGSDATANYDKANKTLQIGVPTGLTGLTGPQGATGPANTLRIGTVTSGSDAGATITGTAPNQTLNLVLPKGDKGDIGPTGPQGPQGVQGEKGDSGVYVGTGDMPEGYNVQIDPSGSGDEIVTAESIQSALGYTPANSADLADKLPKSPADWEPWTAEEQAAARDRMGLDNTCELIETWTNETETPVDFARTQTPDGAPYAYKRMMIRMLGQTPQENWKTIACYTDATNSVKSCRLYAIPKEKWDTYMSVEDGIVVIENHNIAVEGEKPYLNAAYWHNGLDIRRTIQPIGCKKIVKILIGSIPAGSTLYIWATK